MKFRDIILKIGRHTLPLYMSTHDWINDNEAKTYVVAYAQQAGQALLTQEDWEEDDTGVEVDIKKMDEDDFLSATLMDPHVRPVVGVYMLDNPTNSLMMMYRRYDKNVQDESQCLYFGLESEDDSVVDTIGVVNADHPREEVFQQAWKDLQYQCRRYHQMTGLAMALSAVSVSEITSEEYEEERSDRELALV